MTFLLDRRAFLKAAAAGGCALTPVAKAVSAAIDNLETTKWCACVINCGQRCPVRCITKNGRVIRIETDDTSPDTPTGPVRSEPVSAAAPCASAFIRRIDSSIR